MKVTKQRNPYLRRISSDNPHKYSFDIQTGKYMLQYEDGTQLDINKTGTLRPKFKQYFSGFVAHKERYHQALKDPSFMHYVPDFKFSKTNSYHTPMPDKFAGYTQFPYKLNKQFPVHLSKPSQTPRYPMRKSQSQNKRQIKQKKNNSLILEHSTTIFIKTNTSDHYFNMSFASMTQSRPLPKKQKRTCYNYKCKHLKHFVFSQKQKTDASTKFSQNSLSNTLGRSFYQTNLKLQDRQNELISKIN